MQFFALPGGQVPSHRVAMPVEDRGVDFEPQQDYLEGSRTGGGDDALITARRARDQERLSLLDLPFHKFEIYYRQRLRHPRPGSNRWEVWVTRHYGSLPLHCIFFRGSWRPSRKSEIKRQSEF